MTIKYLENGQAVSVIEQVTGGLLVEEVMEDYNGESFAGNVRIVSRVFDKAPTGKFDEQIVRLNNEIESLRVKRREVEDQLASLLTESKTRMAKLTSHKGLKRLEDFLEGRITHYAVLGWSDPTIVEFNETVCDGDRYRKDLRLLTLFGSSNGDLNWQLNRYRDGSGGSETVVPATSYEEAVTIIQEYIRGELGRTSDKPRGNLIGVAKKFDVEIPDEYLSRYRESERAILSKRIAQHQAELERMQGEIAAL